MCFGGIPPPIRGKAWPVMVGNGLKITPELYNMFKSQGKANREMYESAKIINPYAEIDDSDPIRYCYLLLT